MKNSTATPKEGSIHQRYLCRGCRKHFNEQTNTSFSTLISSVRDLMV
ncbi:hypothetical protein SPB21_07285 [Leptothoe sp. ISB3NOV94-8A]